MQPDLRALRPGHRATADGLRCAISGSHAVQAVCPCASLTAMNSAKSSSQFAFAGQNRSNRSRIGVRPALSNRSSSRGHTARRSAITAGKSTAPVWKARWPPVSDSVSSPSWIGRSRLDQQGIAGKRGQAPIGGIAVAGRAERKHLPQPLAGGREKIDQIEGGGPENPRCRRGPAATWDGGLPRLNDGMARDRVLARLSSGRAMRRTRPADPSRSRSSHRPAPPSGR